MKKINKLEALAILETAKKEKKGKIFFAEYLKKDGTKRIIYGKLGVKKGVKGKGLKYNPLSKGLYCVYDNEKKAFRMINLKSIYKLSIGGVKYSVK